MKRILDWMSNPFVSLSTFILAGVTLVFALLNENVALRAQVRVTGGGAVLRRHVTPIQIGTNQKMAISATAKVVGFSCTLSGNWSASGAVCFALIEEGE